MHATVRSAFCTDVVTIDPDAPVSVAQLRLVERGSPELYVVSACGLLLGILPDYEVLKLRLLGAPVAEQRVSDVMATHFETATLDTPLADVACRLRVNVHARIPVIDAGRLVGYVTRHNVLAALLECDGIPRSGPTGMETDSPAGRIEVRPPNFLRRTGTAAAAPGA